MSGLNGSRSGTHSQENWTVRNLRVSSHCLPQCLEPRKKSIFLPPLSLSLPLLLSFCLSRSLFLIFFLSSLSLPLSLPPYCTQSSLQSGAPSLTPTPTFYVLPRPALQETVHPCVLSTPRPQLFSLPLSLFLSLTLSLGFALSLFVSLSPWCANL